MKIKVQTPGELKYPFLNKPVYYSPNFLASLAQNIKIGVEDEHDGPKIADVMELFWQNGALWAYINKKLDMKGKGMSTSLKNWELVEEKDRYIITKGEIKSMARTDSPKDITTYLNNSDEDDFSIITLNNSEDVEDHGDDTVEKDENVETLNQRIGGYKTQLNAKTEENKTLKTKLSDKDQEIQDKDQTIKDKDEELKQYKQAETKKAEKIAKELAGDDEDLLNVYKEMPLAKLKVLQEKQTEEQENNNTGFEGQGDATTGDEQNNGDEEDEENKPDYDTYEEYASKRGGW